VAKKAPAAKAPADEGGEAGTEAATGPAAGRAAAKGPGARKRTAKKAAASAAEDAALAAETTGATTVVAKKTPGTATAAKQPGAVPKARAAAVVPGELAVRPGEDPWTPAEVAEARTELMSEVLRLRSEIQASEDSLAGLMRDSGDGAGDDQADTGTKNITREHEMALAANAREMLEQTERALERLDAGTYGLCENCGQPIGKARMQAFPRATLCVECKQKQERRS
ncbi:TraR/DksA family transcriptional regulator, partial [Streptomyces sp. NPDC059063]